MTYFCYLCIYDKTNIQLMSKLGLELRTMLSLE